jgi:hypothetical protein
VWSCKWSKRRNVGNRLQDDVTTEDHNRYPPAVRTSNLHNDELPASLHERNPGAPVDLCAVLDVVKTAKLSRCPHIGAKGERKYTSYSFLTLVLDVGEWSASHFGRALLAGKDPRYPLYTRLGGPQSRSGHRLEEKFFVSAGDRIPVIQSFVIHYTD